MYTFIRGNNVLHLSEKVNIISNYFPFCVDPLSEEPDVQKSK